MKFFDFFFGKTRPSTRPATPIRGRRLRLESLENRELLSVTAADFAAIQDLYEDLNLTDYDDYNIIEITAEELSDAKIRDAIAEAVDSTENDLIVVRTTDTQNTISLGSTLSISEATGSVAIVSFGAVPLTIDANQVTPAMVVSESTVGLAGLTIENSSHFGLSSAYSSLTVTNCTFSECVGIGISSSDDIDVSISNSVISKNGDGIGIGNNTGQVTIANCTVSENAGRGIANSYCDFPITITNCTITGNTETEYSGAGIFSRACTITIINSVISENSAEDDGGGIFADGASDLTLINCLISDNSSRGEAGGILNTCGPTALTNCTVSGNTATGGAGGIYVAHMDLTLNNTIVANNSGGSYDDVFGNNGVSGRHSLIGNGSGQYKLIDGVDGNIVGTAADPIDPMFANATNGDYRLTVNSPAINAGSNDLALDADGNPLSVDLDGNTRIMNGTVDMGAYEYQGSIVNPPIAPANFRSTGQTANSVTLAWDFQSGLTDYTLKYKKSDDADWSIWTPAPDPAATSATITDLSASTTYDFQLEATNSAGNADSNTSATTEDDIPEPPIAPMNFQSTGQTSNSVTLTWDFQDGLTGYTLKYKKSDDADWSIWTPAPDPAATSATITGLSASTTYEFELTAANSAGSSADSKISATTKDDIPEPPIAPANFQSTSQTSNSVTLAWDFQDGLTGYTLKYKKLDDSDWSTWTPAPDPAATSATITGLSASTTYNFELTATNSLGDASSEATATTESAPITQLPAPVISATAKDATTVTVRWNAVANADGYAVEWATDSEFNTILGTKAAGPTVTSIDIDGLTSGVTYHFRVMALGSGVYTSSDWSDAASVTPSTAPPIVPEDFQSTSQTIDSVTLAWTAQPNLTGYTLECRKSDSDSWTMVAAPSAGATSATVTGLEAETSYEFRLTAINLYGRASTTIDASTNNTVVRPPAPQATASLIGDNVKISWSDVAEADSYQVWRFRIATDGKSNWKNISGKITTTSFIDEEAPQGTLVEYLVRSYKGDVYSEPEFVSIVTPDEPTRPTAPDVTATFDANGVTLTWPAVPGADAYKVYYLNAGQWVTVSPRNFTGTTFTFADASGTYGVRTYIGTDYSEMTVVSGKPTPVDPPAPPVVSASFVPDVGVTLTWSAVTGAETYKVYHLVDGKWDTISEKNFTGTTFTHEGADASGTYGVRAYNSVGYSDMTVVSAKPVVPPAAPVVTPTYLGGRNVQLTWEAVENADSYKVWRRVEGGDWKSVSVNFTDTNFTDETAPLNTTVYYAVRAYTGLRYGDFLEVSVQTTEI